jgi:hypothetical protein
VRVLVPSMSTRCSDSWAREAPSADDQASSSSSQSRRRALSFTL